mmetsp:Transcript_5520/g.15411  ORF Transcript_5520/g.15411 Transcript_5520/m.15411 type:complete len:260 (-) Transcript_5520:391-1170(-)
MVSDWISYIRCMSVSIVARSQSPEPVRSCCARQWPHSLSSVLNSLLAESGKYWQILVQASGATARRRARPLLLTARFPWRQRMSALTSSHGDSTSELRRSRRRSLRVMRSLPEPPEPRRPLLFGVFRECFARFLAFFAAAASARERCSWRSAYLRKFLIQFLDTQKAAGASSSAPGVAIPAVGKNWPRCGVAPAPAPAMPMGARCESAASASEERGLAMALNSGVDAAAESGADTSEATDSTSSSRKRRRGNVGGGDTT